MSQSSLFELICYEEKIKQHNNNKIIRVKSNEMEQWRGTNKVVHTAVDFCGVGAVTNEKNVVVSAAEAAFNTVWLCWLLLLELWQSTTFVLGSHINSGSYCCQAEEVIETDIRYSIGCVRLEAAMTTKAICKASAATGGAGDGCIKHQ